MMLAILAALWAGLPPQVQGTIFAAGLSGVLGGIFLMGRELLTRLTSSERLKLDREKQTFDQWDTDRKFQQSRYDVLCGRFDALLKEHESCVVSQAQLNGQVQYLRTQATVQVLTTEKLRRDLADATVERKRMAQQLRGLEEVIRGGILPAAHDEQPAL